MTTVPNDFATVITFVNEIIKIFCRERRQLINRCVVDLLAYHAPRWCQGNGGDGGGGGGRGDGQT